mgnify:CR=1 FL=1
MPCTQRAEVLILVTFGCNARSLIGAPAECRRFVEEQDRLALALEGRFTKHPLPLQCEGGQQPQHSAAQRHPARQLREELQTEEKILGAKGAAGEARQGEEGAGSGREGKRGGKDVGNLVPLRRLVHKQPRQQDKKL